MEPNQVLPLRVRMKLWVMKIKGYSTFLDVPGLEPHHAVQFIVKMAGYVI